MLLLDLKDLSLCKKLDERMSRAVEYLESSQIETLKDGRYAIAGDDIYMVVSSYLTREHDASQFETHQNYIDIQCLVSGEEFIFWNRAEDMCPDGDYNSETDKQNYFDQEGSACLRLRPGIAAVFYPGDAHKACCKVGDTLKSVQKLLVKVKI